MKFRMGAQALAVAIPVAILLLTLPVQAQKTESADYVVAVVNSEPITNSEVRAAVLRVSNQLKSAAQALPPADELRQGVLERLISDRAQLQLAAESGIVIDEAALDLAEQNLARQNQLDVAGLHQRMAKEGLSAQVLRKQLRELDRNKSYLVTPEGGKRSELAVYLMRQAGLNAYLLNA